MTEDVSRVPTGPNGRKRPSMTQLTPIHKHAPESETPSPLRSSSMTHLHPSNATPVSNGDRITIHDGEQTFV